MAQNSFWKLIGLNKANEANRQQAPNTVSADNKPKTEAERIKKSLHEIAGQTRVWKYPPLSLLSTYSGPPAERGDIKKIADNIEKVLNSFGVQAMITEVNGSPFYTQYALKLALGTREQEIIDLKEIIASHLGIASNDLNIYPITQRNLTAIDVKNKIPEDITFRYLLGSEEMRAYISKLAIVLGYDNVAQPAIADINLLQNVFIWGYNRSELENLLNSILLSLLFRNSPDETKLIIIDPHKTSFINYNGIPHLLTPIVVEPEKILSSLKWSLAEVDRRFRLFQTMSVRNLHGYNEMSGFQALPYVVIIINELAELMTFAPDEFEDAITNLTKNSNTTGVYLLITSQLPNSFRLIRKFKDNFKSRISFKLQNSGESMSLLDQLGAEKLSNSKDMLLVSLTNNEVKNIHEVDISDSEIKNTISFLKNSGIVPEYTHEATEMPIGRLSDSKVIPGKDDLLEEAIRVVTQYDRASASLLQRRLKVGYARAARILDELEEIGIVEVGAGSAPRAVLIRDANDFLSKHEANAKTDDIRLESANLQKSLSHHEPKLEETTTEESSIQDAKNSNMVAKNEAAIQMKEEENYKGVVKEYKNYMEKFCEIAEREVSNIDEWGDENWQVFPRLMKECISRIARNLFSDAYLKSKVAMDKYIDNWFETDLTGENIKVKNNAPLWVRNLFIKDLPEAFSDYHKKRKKKILNKDVNVNNMTGVEFENYIATILKDFGFNVSGTPVTGDQGADLIATKNDKVLVIQAKRYSGAVGNKAIQEVMGALNYYGGDNAVVITNSKFTPAAKKLARKCKVILVEKSELNNIDSKLKADN